MPSYYILIFLVTANKSLLLPWTCFEAKVINKKNFFSIFTTFTTYVVCVNYIRYICVGTTVWGRLRTTDFFDCKVLFTPIVLARNLLR